MKALISGMLSIVLVIAISRTPAFGDAQPPKTIAYDSYDAAIIADICQIAGAGDEFDGDLDHLRAILDRHPELVNARRVFREPHKPGAKDDFAPLHLAAEHGNEKFVALLLDKGADVTSTAGAGWTSLHFAAQGGYLPIVKLLVEHGADVNAKTTLIPEQSSSDLPGQPVGSSDSTQPAIIFPAIPPHTALEIAREQKHADVAEYLKMLAKAR